jgi:hypothetical protein
MENDPTRGTRVPVGNNTDVSSGVVRRGGMGETRGTPSGRRWLVVVLCLVAAALVVAIVVVVRQPDTTSTQQVLLQPVGDSGPDPFTESVAVEEVALQTSVTPTEETDDDIAVSGAQPGLYGGTQDNASCDALSLVSFLEANPDKATAWADALDIEPVEIRDYVGRLTPLLLRTDTRVTNHGYRDGIATPLQSVLQAGTAVMVDDYGIPRVRCSCGNPLTEPAPIATSLDSNQIDLVGQPWNHWNPTTVITVNATTQINDFTVYDIDTNLTYTQPTGTDVSGSSTETGNADVILSGDGIRVRNPDGSNSSFGFDDPVADVAEALEAASTMGSSSSGRCTFLFDGLTVEGDDDGIFVRWTLNPGGFGGPGEIDPLLFKTDRGLTVGANRADVERAYPNAAPGTGADSTSLIDGGLVFRFYSYGSSPVDEQVDQMVGQQAPGTPAC